MFVIVVAVGASAIWSVMGWNEAARKLSFINAKASRAEKLRSNMYHQINLGLDFIDGDFNAQERFHQIQNTALQVFRDLKADTLTREEMEHIQGLEETQFELVWLMNTFFEKSQSAGRFDRQLSRARLREIADEVTDDMSTLNQYYRTQENLSLIAATRAGDLVTFVIATSTIIVAFQLVALVFLLQRWLARPIEIVSRATEKISAGDFDVQIALSVKDEWGNLALAINQMAKSLKISRQKLITQERLAALGEVASYTSHNLRNPLAGIRAAAQVAIKELPDANSETACSFMQIIEEVDRLDLWIKHFLAFAKPLQLSVEKTNINDLVDQVAALAQKSFAEARIQFQWRLADNLPQIEVDGILLEQALFAVIVNALEASPPGGKVKIETLTIQSDDGGDRLVIRVSDNGPGIPSQLLPKLFQPFVSSKENGTGLGLAQAKKIVDLHGGEIRLDSLPDKGTTVSIRLRIGGIASLKDTPR
jgi:signal transduction histidine kinase